MSYDPLFKVGDLLVYKATINDLSAISATMLVLDPKPDAGNRILVKVEGRFNPKVFDTTRPVRMFQTYLQHPAPTCRKK